MLEKEVITTKEKNFDPTIPLVLLTIAISLLDFYTHPNSGLADPERRKALEQLIGNLANHIGNYGFSAALATTAIIAKNLFNQTFHSEITRTVIKRGSQLSLAAIIALNALIEDFPKNNEFLGDFLMGTLGVFMAATATQLLINKFKKIT